MRLSLLVSCWNHKQVCSEKRVVQWDSLWPSFNFNWTLRREILFASPDWFAKKCLPLLCKKRAFLSSMCLLWMRALLSRDSHFLFCAMIDLLADLLFMAEIKERLDCIKSWPKSLLELILCSTWKLCMEDVDSCAREWREREREILHLATSPDCTLNSRCRLVTREQLITHDSSQRETPEETTARHFCMTSGAWSSLLSCWIQFNCFSCKDACFAETQ